MLAIAELCGGSTAERARAAAVYLSRRSDDASLGVELLRDIRDLFASRGADRLESTDVVNNLVAMEDRPWAEMPFSGKSITQAGVARLLKPFKVKPAQVRFGQHTRKGYKLAWFEKAFRYVPNRAGVVGDLLDRGNNETKTEFCEKRRNTCLGNVSAKMAKNSQCFGVSPNQGDLENQDASAGSDAAAAFEERCAALEYDGGFTRATAEALAAEEMPDLPDFSDRRLAR